MWRTFEAWDLLQMLLSDEIYLDAMMLPPFRVIGTTLIHEHWQLGHYRNWVLKFCLSHYSQIDGSKDAFFLRSHASFLFIFLLNSGGKALTGSLHVLEGGPSDLV